MAIDNIDSREVLCYLNELGYKNVTQLQLKDFIKDLKKLIKYEKRQARTTDIAPKGAPFSPFLPSFFEPEKVLQFDEEQKKGKKITIEVLKKNDVNTCKITSHCSACFQEQTKFKNKDSSRNIKEKQGDCFNLNLKDENKEVKITHRNNHFLSSNGSQSASVGFPIDIKTNSSDKSSLPKSQTECSLKSNNVFTFRSKSSLIRPRIPLKPIRSDPVTRYHYYQKEWSKAKFPGEDNHLQLRWAVRERILEGPPLEVVAGVKFSQMTKKSKST